MKTLSIRNQQCDNCGKVVPSGKSLYAPVDNSLRLTRTKALGNGFVSCSDKGAITPIVTSINLLSASR